MKFPHTLEGMAMIFGELMMLFKYVFSVESITHFHLDMNQCIRCMVLRKWNKDKDARKGREKEVFSQEGLA